MFIGSIRGKADHALAYQKIIETLETSQHQVIHDHITQYTQEKLDNLSKEENVAFCNQILSDIRTADVVIAECSYQSLSMGYLLSYSIDIGKPTIVFFNANSPKPNLFPTLAQSEKFLLSTYHNVDELPKLVNAQMEEAKVRMDVRFNFFVPPKISNYLDWLTKHRTLPRSVYLRQLIQHDLENNPDFQKTLLP
jgi:hypothetical protein